jgi:hypothetical protein
MPMKAEAQDVISLDFIPGAPESPRAKTMEICSPRDPKKVLRSSSSKCRREEMTLFSHVRSRGGEGRGEEPLISVFP